MNEQEKALQAEGQVKFAQNPQQPAELLPRERLLLPLTFCFCLLLVNTFFATGPTAGLTAAVCAWYGLLAVCLGRKLTASGESRFLLAVNLALAATLALASSFRDKPVPADLAAIGEVGLTGELRSVNALGQRLAEVRRLGFTKCIIPRRVHGKLAVPEGLELIRVSNIREAMAALL